MAGRAHPEGITGRPVTLFAYPNDKPVENYALEHVAMVTGNFPRQAATLQAV